jgi:hypothetical protein
MMNQVYGRSSIFIGRADLETPVEKPPEEEAKPEKLTPFFTFHDFTPERVTNPAIRHLKIRAESFIVL